MKRSESRILTTHTGSLPRPEGLVAMLGALSRGEPVDEAALTEAAREATADVVRAQAESGVDVINSGEQSRISFSTYVTQRMSGFGGTWTRRGHRDQNEFASIARPRVVQLDARRSDVRGASVIRPAGHCRAGMRRPAQLPLPSPGWPTRNSL